MELDRNTDALHIDTSQHLSLACVEILVHLDKNQLPRDYVWSRTEAPDTTELLYADQLNDVASCQTAGQSWVHGSRQLAVRVPSVITPDEFNVLLNPYHPSYPNLVWSTPLPFRFDPRLFTAEPQAQ